jgi:hypothetical protein
MITAWTKNLKTAKDIDEFEKYVRGSTRLLDRLKEILHENLSQLDSREVSSTDFDDPNWSFRQAFRNGQRSTLKNLIRLTTLDHRSEDESTGRGRPTTTTVR